MAKKKPEAAIDKKYITKKCHECYEYVPLDAEVCPACKARLGPVQDHGIANRRINWKAYIICIVAWLALILYLKWAFF